MIELILVAVSLFLGFRLGHAAHASKIRDAIERGYLVEGDGWESNSGLESEPESEYRSHATCDACGIGSYIGTEVLDTVPQPWYCPRCAPNNCTGDGSTCQMGHDHP